MSLRAVLMSSILAFTLLLATVVLLVLVDRRLRASERRYRHLVEHSLGLICCHDLDGKLLWINPEAARILGYDPRRAVGVSAWPRSWPLEPVPSSTLIWTRFGASIRPAASCVS